MLIVKVQISTSTYSYFIISTLGESVTTLLESRDPRRKTGPMSGRDSGHWANLVIFPINCLKNLSWCQRCPVWVWPGCSSLMDRWTNGGLDEELSKENILIWHKICGGEREREISTWSKVQLLSSFNYLHFRFYEPGLAQGWEMRGFEVKQIAFVLW